MPNPPSSFTFRVRSTQAGTRLDALVAGEIEHCSRAFAARLIRQKDILVDGSAKKPGYTVKGGETVCGTIAPPVASPFLPEAIPLQILFEDAELLV